MLIKDTAFFFNNALSIGEVFHSVVMFSLFTPHIWTLTINFKLMNNNILSTTFEHSFKKLTDRGHLNSILQVLLQAMNAELEEMIAH